MLPSANECYLVATTVLTSAGQVDVISLWGVDLSSVPPLQLSALVHAVTQGVRINSVTGASHFSVQTLLIIFIPGDLSPVLQCVQRGWVGVSGQELGEGDTMNLVTAMEERVEEVHLGSWGAAAIHLPTLASYSGRGRCA